MAHSRRLRLAIGAVTAALCLAPFAPVQAAIPGVGRLTGLEAPAACPTGSVPLFAAAATPVSNGYFFPGAAFYEGKKFVGAPYTIPKGCNLRFINTDVSVLTNKHRIMSLKRKKGVPLFWSKAVAGPGETTVKTSHLKPGTYAYYCSIHYGMFGQIEVSADL